MNRKQPAEDQVTRFWVRNQQGSPGIAPASDTRTNELVNAITHGVGLVLSVIGGIALLACVLFQGEVWRIVGCCIFATTLVAVYTVSTLSHSSLKPEWKRLFERLDQGFIYLLIAGTYTPFALTYLCTGWWWLLLGIMWAAALCGCFLKVLLPHRIKGVAVWSYVLLGWTPMIAARPLIELIPAAVLWWMLIGGLCYTIGTVFLIYDNKRFHFHAIWHMFVIAGSTCHFLPVFFFVSNATASPV